MDAEKIGDLLMRSDGVSREEESEGVGQERTSPGSCHLSRLCLILNGLQQLFGPS